MGFAVSWGHTLMGAWAVLTARSQEDAGHEGSGHGKGAGRVFLGMLLREGSLLNRVGHGA